LLESQWANQKTLAAWRKAAKTQVEEAVADAQREPPADPGTETWCPYATAKIADALLIR
jgi:TPP-dependent pyruvate/acetoin dehydrogenase alpha subunit